MVGRRYRSVSKEYATTPGHWSYLLGDGGGDTGAGDGEGQWSRRALYGARQAGVCLGVAELHGGKGEVKGEL